VTSGSSKFEKTRQKFRLKFWRCDFSPKLSRSAKCRHVNEWTFSTSSSASSDTAPSCAGKYSFTSCGLYYKPMMIVNDDSRVINKLEASLTDDTIVITYDHHMFIVQSTDQSLILLFVRINQVYLLKIFCSLFRITTR
jgi:hypothetical protein